MMWDEPSSKPKQETCCVLPAVTKTSSYSWEATDQSQQEVVKFKVILDFFWSESSFHLLGCCMSETLTPVIRVNNAYRLSYFLNTVS